MYSPKIDEGLIPALYHTAKNRGFPMTELVKTLLIKALTEEDLPESAQEAYEVYLAKGQEKDRKRTTTIK